MQSLESLTLAFNDIFRYALLPCIDIGWLERKVENVSFWAKAEAVWGGAVVWNGKWCVGSENGFIVGNMYLGFSMEVWIGHIQNMLNESIQYRYVYILYSIQYNIYTHAMYFLMGEYGVYGAPL